jgi:hypothetical protein
MLPAHNRSGNLQSLATATLLLQMQMVLGQETAKCTDFGNWQELNTADANRRGCYSSTLSSSFFLPQSDAA